MHPFFFLLKLRNIVNYSQLQSWLDWILEVNVVVVFLNRKIT